ncbi:hypothetical protein [Actinokineospora sp. NBRC 105648]|uniref:hypothetical protein n=1 Tax=Actinokineospora sp. NBRC 105648 TaxID=3032206 RepID=UPI0024A30031|nr:hypothetical protein [Actinokineospora sp. NBRC 105648]GLZ38588.1 hypothetical protein Acsp05_22120 [Actinokineospora sp. NBRC 105648]
MMMAEGTDVDDMIFQPSDLATQRRVQFMDAARSGRARLRDKDGSAFVMLPEGKVELLEELARWNSAHLRLERLLERGEPLSVSTLGELAWLRVFDTEDIREFLSELHEALVASYADGALATLRECVEAWRTTARQVEDPLRRSVLRGSLAAQDLTEALRPDGT